ncbi:uncharacterized protein [Henckelia pumila]|uniref:uncharacterized protein isoform X2 n=1 Tax=Henckelia pumila TaxID=405737 RepID=UPI003C6DB943
MVRQCTVPVKSRINIVEMELSSCKNQIACLRKNLITEKRRRQKVVGCNKFRNTEWISRQDPYVCMDYTCSKHRTRTRHGGGRYPTFQEKFEITLGVYFRATTTVADLLRTEKAAIWIQ